MSSTSTCNIRNVQYQNLVEMLNFNLPETPNRPVWKLFIMDTAGQKILAPLIKVNDLREHGVTLFLQLNSQRERVPNVPAIYFIEPTNSSISSLCHDLKSNLYDNYFINFTSHISRDLLEELAQVSHETQSQLKISKIYDQYLNYITLEDNLFTLEIPKITLKLLQEIGHESEKEVSSIVSGIFSVLMSFGCCAPIIGTISSIGSSEGASSSQLLKNISGKLESKIKNHLINMKSSISLSNPQLSANQSRPLLLIIDRRIDLAGPLKHSASYNSLIDENLGLNSNQIKIAKDGKSFDIDRRDWFWKENSTKLFPKVAEAVESALKTYKTDYDRVLQTTPGMTEDLMKTSGVTGGTPSSNSLTPEQLKIAINILPELTERKRIIDTHLQISTALLESIKNRDLGTLFNIEQEIISQSSQSSTQEILSALKDEKMGNSHDKLRLILIYLIYNNSKISNNNFISEVLSILKLSENDLKTFKTILNISNSHPIPVNFSTSSSINNSPKSPDSSAFVGDLFNRITSTTNVLVSSVRNLIPNTGISESILSKFIDSSYAQVTGKIINQNQNSNLSIIDPRPTKSGNQLQSHSIDHVIVFLVGGAAYSEYDHLIDHFNNNKYLQNLKFTFGSTEILNSKSFLTQLSEINN